MPLNLFGSVAYYLRAAGFNSADGDFNSSVDNVLTSVDTLFDKRYKAMHRYSIADVNGPLTLTVPIVKPHGIRNARWSDVRISSHNRWWHTHMVSLESAYGQTPFFEFYIDRFRRFFSSDTPDAFQSIQEYTLEADKEIRNILLLNPLQPTSEPPSPDFNTAPAIEPYYQVRSNTLGFLPGLSVLDLIFNMGPESALYIRRQGGVKNC